MIREIKMENVFNTKTKNENIANYMSSVYLHMTRLLATSLLSAILISNTPLKMFFFVGNSLTILGWITMLAPIVVMLGMMFIKPDVDAVILNYVVYFVAATIGLSFSILALKFATASIVNMFLLTTTVFGTLSIYGYTTKRDLSGIGQFLMMGFIGLIALTVINLFIASSLFGNILSFMGLLIFSGFVVYDNQNIKNEYNDYGYSKERYIMHSFSLYLNFINIFFILMDLLGYKD